MASKPLPGFWSHEDIRASNRPLIADILLASYLLVRTNAYEILAEKALAQAKRVGIPLAFAG